jgi:hypothetical protein
MIIKGPPARIVGDYDLRGVSVATEIITGDIWTELIRTRRKRHRRAWVAVAYFGKGAAKLLSLKKGSELVIDASESAIKQRSDLP